MPPNSSTTSAIWARDRRICSSRSSTRIDGATNIGARMIFCSWKVFGSKM